MTADSTPHRREGRFLVVSDETRVTLTCRQTDGSSLQLCGHLADISPQGVRIDVDGPVTPGQRVSLRIEAPRASLVLERSAVVRWQQPRDATTWWTGCVLEDAFDPEVIEQLATSGILNRRRDARYDVDMAARVRGELADSIHQVQLLNYSKGGFCVRFTHAPKFPHDRLMLMIEVEGQSVTVPARVMWHRSQGDGFIVGCAFTNSEGFVQVREFAAPGRSGVQSVPDCRSTPLASWIALAMAITIALQVAWVLRTHPAWGDALRDRWTTWIVEPLDQGLPAQFKSSPATRTRPSRAGSETKSERLEAELSRQSESVTRRTE